MTWEKVKKLYSRYVREGRFDAAHMVLTLLREKTLTLFLDSLSCEVEIELEKAGAKITYPSWRRGGQAVAKIRKPDPKPEQKAEPKNVAMFGDVKLRLPKGYRLNENGLYQNGHGVEYALMKYGWKEDIAYFLESTSKRYDRRVELEVLN